MKINKIKIEEFTLLDGLEMDFDNGINIIFGENANGKTHLIKLLYAFSNSTNLNFIKSVKNIFTKDTTFKNITITSNDKTYDLSQLKSVKKDEYDSIFIPQYDVLSYAKSIKNNFDDKIILDVLNLCKLKEKTSFTSDELTFIDAIRQIIDGDVQYENETFYIKKRDGKLLDIKLEADSFKKFALIQKLFKNGVLKDGSILFLDEPQSGLSKPLYPILADLIIYLERTGIQIFLATSDEYFNELFELKRN